jgi:hypothetical protein
MDGFQRLEILKEAFIKVQGWNLQGFLKSLMLKEFDDLKKI